MQISIPKLTLVVLVGPSGSGKSTFAKKHFLPTEVLSSDTCRGLLCDEENNQAATKDAFELLHFIASKRLALGRLTVIDATNRIGVGAPDGFASNAEFVKSRTNGPTAKSFNVNGARLYGELGNARSKPGSGSTPCEKLERDSNFAIFS